MKVRDDGMVGRGLPENNRLKVFSKAREVYSRVTRVQKLGGNPPVTAALV